MLYDQMLIKIHVTPEADGCGISCLEVLKIRGAFTRRVSNRTWLLRHLGYTFSGAGKAARHAKKCGCILMGLFPSVRSRARRCFGGFFQATYLHTSKHAHMHKCVHVLTCMHWHTYVQADTHIHGDTHTHTDTPANANMPACMHTQIHTYTRTSVHTHTYTHECKCTYIHTYIHAYVHTYILIYFNTCKDACVPAYILYIHTYTRECKRANMNAHICTCMHAYIRTHLHMNADKQTNKHTCMHS